jgi:predicted HTH transcriptional regulator
MTEPAREVFSRDLQALIDEPREVRSVEYKGPVSWQTAQLKIIKTVLAMSNLQDGGYIVIGVAQGDDGVLRPGGLSQADLESYREDDINDQIRRYADPPFSVQLTKGPHAARLFVVLRVPPFGELPTICRRDAGPASELREGAIYTRSIHKPETVEVRSQNEMREIVQRAVDLEIRSLIARFPALGDRSATVHEAFRRERGLFD